MFTLQHRLADYNIRNSINNVNIPRWQKALCRRTSFYLGPLQWNSLTQNFKTIGNIDSFKKKCKSLLLQQQNANER